MGKVNDFLAANKELASAEEKLTDLVSSDSVVISVIVLAISEERVVFGHLGAKFEVNKNDVLDVSDTTEAIPNPWGVGKPATISLNPQARLRRDVRLLATDLVAGVPYAIARPSLSEEIYFESTSPREAEWMESHGLPSEPTFGTTAATQTYCNSTSPKWSGTISNGRRDDGKSDEYYNDDHRADDFRRDLI
jgi:hypothetical protein